MLSEEQVLAFPLQWSFPLHDTVDGDARHGLLLRDVPSALYTPPAPTKRCILDERLAVWDSLFSCLERCWKRDSTLAAVTFLQ
jgi:hypothetical protein